MFSLKKYLTAPVTYTLIWINIIMMGAEYYVSNSFSLTESALRRLGAVSHHDYSVHIFTYMFLHGGIFHIFMNMMALSFFGRQVEKIWGSFNFALIYFVSGLAGGIAIVEFSHVNSITVGASGAIMGVLGAYIAVLLKYKTYKTHFGKKMLKDLIVDCMLTFALGLLPFISGMGHAGGFIAGFVFTWILFSIKTPYTLFHWKENLV